MIKLEQNYRSTGRILDAAHAVVSRNSGRKGKKLWTDGPQGDKLKVRQLTDEHEEARYVAGEIQRLTEGGVSNNDVAVFYRTNAQSRVLEDTLVRYRMPYQVIGGTRFYERAEVKDALAYLTMLANPNDAGLAAAHHQLAAPRNRQDDRRSPARLREHDRRAGARSGRSGRRGPGSRRRRAEGVGAILGDDGFAAREGRDREARR